MQRSSFAHDLLNPGSAENFFDLPGLPEFEPGETRAFSAINAVWLAEFSRLIYCVGRGVRDGVLASKAPAWRSIAAGEMETVRFESFVLAERVCTCVVFRGTRGLRDMLTDVQIAAVPWEGPGMIHRGFKLEFDGLWSAVARTLKVIDGPIFLAGHSLGGAIATIVAARMLQDDIMVKPAAVYSFGSPRVGDAGFAKTTESIFHCRMVLDDDVIATFPPPFSLPTFPIYRHAGSLHHIRNGRVQVIGIDPTDGHPMNARLRRLLINAHRICADSAAFSGNLPAALMDHAPVNYVAALMSLLGPSGTHDRGV